MMKLLPAAAVVFASLFQTALLQEDKIAFVYEITRHGARAPQRNLNPEKFKVGLG